MRSLPLILLSGAALWAVELFTVELIAAELVAAEQPPLVPGTLAWDWIGNSHSTFTPGAENGVGKWVQNFIDEMEVTPDGTVVVGCEWDEGGRCLGLYKDGQTNLSCLGKNDRHGGHKGGGWGTGSSAMTVVGDQILCASVDGEFFRFGWKPGDIDSAKYRDAFVHGFGNVDQDKQAVRVIGMNARGGRVAVLLADGRIQVRALADWAVQAAFVGAGVRDLCWGSDATLWLADATSVREVSDAGIPTGRTAPDVGAPSAVAVAPDGRLVVCDDGPRQQVRWYDVKAVPRLLGTFGQVGGISAGTPGVPTPDKLMRPAGANFDANGNLYVGMRYDEYTPTGGFILRSFSPAGALRWEQSCHVFSECMDVVSKPDGSLTAYGYRSTFTKAAQAARGEWKLDAITLDTRTQTEDPRYRKALEQATTAYREIAGKPYVFSWGSGGNSALQITRLDANGRLGAHVATIGTPGPWAWEVDARGDVWCDDHQTAVLRYKANGGTWGVAERFPAPAGMTQIERLLYDADHDRMYVSGYTETIPKPNGEWGLMGRALLRVDGFTSGKPAVTWVVQNLRLDDGGLPPKAVAWAGDYLFTAACKPTAGLRGQIYVYRISDGGFVGRISAPQEIAENTGWIDLSHGLRARLLPDGRYCLTQEDNLRAKVIVHYWTPKG